MTGKEIIYNSTHSVKGILEYEDGKLMFKDLKKGENHSFCANKPGAWKLKFPDNHCVKFEYFHYDFHYPRKTKLNLIAHTLKLEGTIHNPVDFKLNTMITINGEKVVEPYKNGDFKAFLKYDEIDPKSTLIITPFNFDFDSLIYYVPSRAEVRLDAESCLEKLSFTANMGIILKGKIDPPV